MTPRCLCRVGSVPVVKCKQTLAAGSYSWADRRECMASKFVVNTAAPPPPNPPSPCTCSNWSAEWCMSESHLATAKFHTSHNPCSCSTASTVFSYLDSCSFYLHCFKHEVHTNCVSVPLDVDSMFKPLHCTSFPYSSIAN